MNNKNKMNKLIKELYDNGISLRKFLLYYCGLSIENYKNIKLSHSDIKVLMPYLKKVSYEYLLSNKSELYNGNIVAVIDSYNNIAPYITPKMVKENDLVNIDVKREKNKNIIKNAILNENLNTYELSELCKAYKKVGRFKEYRIAHNLLKSKKDLKVKKYKKQKELLKMEGRGL